MISIPTVYFFITLGIFVSALLATGGFYYLRYRRRQKYPYGKWENILKRLSAVDRNQVALIALDFVDESGNRRARRQDSKLDQLQIWSLIGGMEGLEALERNCAVLIDLAFYVQQWYPEALAIASQLRVNAREIEWHVSRLKSAEKAGRLETFFPEYAQRAIVAYYLMTRCVLDLYEQGNLPGLAELQRAL